MEIMVAGEVAIEAYSVEESVEDNLVAEAVDAEDKMAEAKVVAVAMDKDGIMETKGITLMLNFTDSRTILTLKILHFMTTNGIINSCKNIQTQSWYCENFGTRTAILTIWKEVDVNNHNNTSVL